MSRRSKPGAWRLVTSTVRIFYRAHGLVESLVNRGLLAALPDEALADLSLSAYSGQKFGSRSWNEKGLYDWEAAFVETHLSGGDRRVLVPGCGGGRESLHLARRSCRVVAFDPVASFLGVLQEAARDEDLPVVVLHGAIEDMLDDGPHDPASTSAFPPVTRERIRSEGPYDAVIFGWGSITHVLDLERLVDALRFVAGPDVCPAGPVLISFWMIDREPRIDGPLARLFARVGRRSSRETLSRGIYGRYFERGEIEDLARRAGYRIASGNVGDDTNLDYTYHAVLVRDGEAAGRSHG